MASIQKRPDGRYRARYRDPEGTEHAKHFRRKTDAQSWIDQQTAAIVTGTHVAPRAGKVTFREFVTDWSARQVWAPSTLRSFTNTFGQVPFGNVALAAVRRSQLESWVKAMSNAGLAPSTVQTRVTHVRAAFRAAVNERLVASDPTRGLTLPRQRRHEASMRIPTPSEVAALVQHATLEGGLFVQLCAFAGLRRGEALGLKVDDVDFLGRSLRVRRQVHEGVVTTPKFGSERDVYLADALVLALSVHLAGGRGADGWLFPGATGQPNASWAQDRFAEARAASGVAGVRIHDLRHFYASGLIAKGCDVVTVQRALGHANATTTLRVYAHLWPSAEDRTRTAAAALMAEAGCGLSADRAASN